MLTLDKLGIRGDALASIRSAISKPYGMILTSGPTGSGKTTFINLIPRLYDTLDGEVLIDGIDVRKIPLDVLRTNIGLVPRIVSFFRYSCK